MQQTKEISRIDVPRDFLEDNVNRYRKLMRGEKIEHAPFRLWLDNTFVCYHAKVDPIKYSTDLEVMFAAQKVVNDRFYDLRDFTIDVGNMDIFFDFDAFHRDYPNARHFRVLEPSLDNFDKYCCRTPIRECECVENINNAVKYFNDRLPEHKKVGYYLGITGAMDLFSIIRGTEHFFMDLYDKPQKVKRVFDFYLERALEWLEFANEQWGEYNLKNNNLHDKVDIGEDYCAYLPPDLFRDFVVPYTGKIFETWKGRKLCSLHTDGDVVASGIELLNEANVEELMGFSPNIDINQYRKALPDVILGGNIHPIEVMIEGTPEDVKKAAKYCFESANRNQKFVLCTGGAISAGAKDENVDAFIEAAYEIVRY
jgi:hypothetical protein